MKTPIYTEEAKQRIYAADDAYQAVLAEEKKAHPDLAFGIRGMQRVLDAFEAYKLVCATEYKEAIAKAEGRA